MKRILSFTIFLGILILAFQFLVVFFTKEHNIEYSLTKDNETFAIVEKLLESDNEPIYQFQVTWNDKLFLFENKHDYNKQDKIITDIKYFKNDQAQCIYPVYVDDKEDVHDPICNQNGNLYSYTALKSENSSIASFQEELLKDGYHLPSWEPSSEQKEYTGLYTYQADIPQNIYVGVWKYQGIESLSQNDEKYTSLLLVDAYQKKPLLVDNYFVMPNIDTTSEFNSILITDITLFGKSTIELEKGISNNYYFNGVVDGKAYLFDKTNVKQYEINPKEKSIREIGNTEVNAQYYDGNTWQDRNIYDFVNSTILFGKDYHQVEGIKNYPFKEVVETDNSFYYIDSSNHLYRLYKSNLDNPILLCTAPSLKELRVTNDYVFFISGNTIYFYHDAYGQRPLITYNEFLYNAEGVYNVYYKK